MLVVPVLLWKLCFDDWIPKEGWKEGCTGFPEGLTGTLDVITRVTAMVMTSANSPVSLFMPVSVDRGEKRTFNWKTHRVPDSFFKPSWSVMNFESNTVIEIDLIEICAYLQ